MAKSALRQGYLPEGGKEVFGSIRQVVSRLVQAGRIGRKRSFAIALVVGLLALPVTEALAYYGATGTGTISQVGAGASASTVTIAQVTSFQTVYTGPSTTNLQPGGTATVDMGFTCATACTISSISLQSWSADATHATAGCTSALMPGSFSITKNTQTFPWSLVANTQTTDQITLTWANLPTIDQTPCAGASFTFDISTP